MADLKELEQALIAADSAGNTDDAAVLAAEIDKMRGGQNASAAGHGAGGSWGPSRELNLPNRKEIEAQIKAFAGGGFDMGAQGIATGVGQVVGSRFGPLGARAGGAVGGLIGDAIAQGRRLLTGEQKEYKPGEAVGATVSGMLPGGAGLNTTRAVVKEGVRQGAGAVVAGNAQSLIDDGELLSGGQNAVAAGMGGLGGAAGQKMNNIDPRVQAAVAAEMAKNATKRESLEAGRKLGLAVKPSSVGNTSLVNQALESIAGRGALSDDLKIKNQKAIDAAARVHAGLGENVDLTPENLDAVRDTKTGPYKAIAALQEQGAKGVADIERQTLSSDPHEQAVARAEPAVADQLALYKKQAAADIEELKSVRSNATGLRRQNAANYNHDVAQKVAALDEQADVLEGRIAEAAKALGRPELVDQLKQARTDIAKTHDVERALEQGTSSVNGQKIGADYQKNPGKMTGELADIGAFQRNFPDAVGTGKSIQNPASTGTNIPVGMAGAALGGPGTASKVAGAVASLVRGPARAVLMSGPYQKNFANLNPDLGDIKETIKAAVAREVAKAAARKKDDKK